MPLYSLGVQTLVAIWKPGSGTYELSSLPQYEKNIFVPSDSNHMMMSSITCKHGCVVRIPPSIDRVLRNGIPA